MTLDFHPLDLSDAPTVWKYVQHSGRRNCDLSFANLYAWRPLFQTEICEWNGFLLFRFYADGHLAYLMPVGNGDLRRVTDALLDDSARLNHPLLILGVCDDLLPNIKQCLDDDVRINANRNYADYVYLRQSLASLAGKKLQPKRNHAHHFKNTYPDYRYEPLSDLHVPACLELSRRWENARTERARQRSVEAEAEAIRRALTHHKELGLHGGVLLVGEQIAAFTYGAPISDDTFDICVEKADEQFEGAYAVINQEFASRLPNRFIYVNREEDMGMEGLRKAKLSYHPAMLLTKYSVWTARMLKPKIETAGLSEHDFLVKTHVRALWKLCFDDPGPFMDLYFNHIYKPALNTCIEENGRVTSALQRLPYQMIYGDAIPVAYVSGVCTLPERRGNGLASELMRQAHRQMFADGKVFAVLIPADTELELFYKRFGYFSSNTAPHRPVILPVPCDNPTFTVHLSMPDNRLDEWQSYLDTRLRRVPFAFLHDADNLRAALANVFLSNGCVAEARTDGRCCGLLIAAPIADGLVMILEQFADSDDIAASLKHAARTALDEEGVCVIQRNTVMLRVINVIEALRAYARLHPDVHMLLRITGDEHIPENNGLYALRGGLCEKVSEKDDCPENSPDSCKEIPVGSLPALLFPDKGPYLSLMNN